MEKGEDIRCVSEGCSLIIGGPLVQKWRTCKRGGILKYSLPLKHDRGVCACALKNSLPLKLHQAQALYN